MSEISVVLIEDHDLSRIGLTAALQRVEGIKVIGEAANGKQGLEVILKTKPDVAIVDIGLPDMDGIELTQKLKNSQENSEDKTKVLILTMHKTDESVLAAFAAGADSYSVKDVSIETLVQAIEVTNEGNPWVDPAIARVVLKNARNSTQPPTTSFAPSNEHTTTIEALDPEYQQMLDSDPLTNRELEVLELIVSGCNNASIAEKLYITVGTVKTHVRNILNKLCVDDRTQAAVRALRSGLVE